MSASKSWVIGSSPNCDIVVTKPNVSRRHCRLILQGRRFYLEDLDSTNGTFVNGVQISDRVEVHQRDEIVLGSNVLFPWPDEVQNQPTPPPLPSARSRGGMEHRQPTPAKQAPLVEPTIVDSLDSAPKQIRIGRDASNDLVLDYPMVSSVHAVLTIRDGQAILEDLDSTNGTAINSPDNTIRQQVLNAKDVVFFGSLRVPAAKLLAVHPKIGSQPQESFTFAGREMIFGRNAGCDQVLEYPMISGRHARVFRQGEKLMVEDLQSANGTFVNGSRIHRPVEISPGDAISLGSYTFTLGDGGHFEKRDFRGNVTIEARNVGIMAGGKSLIEGVSLTIFPSEFVGLMGPSGAGKTTLMNALNGYTPPTSGEVLFNGRNLYGDYAQFAPSLGYVPQDDIIHRDLTVGQALYYTAKLRLPPDTTDDEIENRITRVLAQLGLEGTRDVLVGSPEKKGISGGQRKRVNLAMELLTDPSVLFLDEPTSGLSSEDALMVMKLLRELADSGKAILLTIHQPSLEAYRLMDNLVLMGKDQNSTEPGQLVYYGPAYPDAVEFFNPAGVPNLSPGTEPSPDAILSGFAQQPSQVWRQSFETSPFISKYVKDRAGRTASTSSSQSIQETEKPFGFVQWMTLVRRYFTLKLKDTTNTAILLTQAPIVAFLVVMVFGRDARQANPADYEEWLAMAQKSSTSLFLMGLAALWFGCSNAAREIVGEWAIYHRERMVNLKLPSYLGSKYTVLGGLCFLQCLVLTTVVFTGCGLQGSALGTLLILLLVSMVGVGIGLCISSITKTSEAAIALLPIVLLPMVILGGLMQPIHEMPGVMRWASNVIPTRWAFETLVVMESNNRPLGEKPVTDPREEPEEVDVADDFFPKEERSQGFLRLLVLCSMLVVLVGGNLLILRTRDVH